MRENRIGVACACACRSRSSSALTAGGGGLANSGEDDMENYNAMVTSRVREPSKPNVRKVLRLAQIACFGREYDLSHHYRPLRVLSAEQEENVKKSKQERYQSLYHDKVIDSQELGELLHKDKLVPIRTKALEGKLPPNPEVPTTEEMFAEKKPQEGETKDGERKPEDDADD
jgi:hypothetical protein